jgi:dihydroneopterin aldolase
MAATMSPAYLARVHDGKRALYTRLAESISQGVYREVDNAGHSTIHIDRPDAVVEVVRELLDMVNKRVC